RLGERWHRRGSAQRSGHAKVAGRSAPGRADPRVPPRAPPGARPVPPWWAASVAAGTGPRRGRRADVSVLLCRQGCSALCLAQAPPDPVRLTDAERVLEARLAHRTRGADGLGLLLPTQLLALALEVRRREEHGGLRAATRGAHLPIFFNALCTHRHTPPSSGGR